MRAQEHEQGTCSDNRAEGAQDTEGWKQVKSATPKDTWDHMFGSGATTYSWWLKLKFTGVHDGEVEPGWSCELTCDNGNGGRKTKIVSHVVVMSYARHVMSHDIEYIGEATKRECRNLVFDADDVDFDAASADNLLQYIVLGEVVFG
jgi:hypothetical protein